MGRGLTTCLLYVHHREQFKVTSDSKGTHNKTWDKGTKAEDLWKACAPGLQRLALGKGTKVVDLWKACAPELQRLATWVRVLRLREWHTASYSWQQLFHYFSGHRAARSLPNQTSCSGSTPLPHVPWNWAHILK